MGGKMFSMDGLTVLGNSEAVEDVRDMMSVKTEDDTDKKDEKPALLNGDDAFAKNLKKMFPEKSPSASNGARPKETRATQVIGKKERKEENRKPANSPEEKESSEEDMVLSPKLLAALAGPDGDQEKIIRIMKASGINTRVPEEESRQDGAEESPHQKLRRGVEALGGKMVSLGGMTVLGNSGAVQNLVSGGGVTVLGQAGAVDDFMSTVKQGGNNFGTGITVLGQAGAVDAFTKSALRAGSQEDSKPDSPNSAFLENGDPRPGRLFFLNRFFIF